MSHEHDYTLHERPLQCHMEFARFDPEEISSGGVVVNVGGGFAQVFETELRALRSDITVYTLDPSTVAKKVAYGMEGREGRTSGYLGPDERVDRRKNLVRVSGGRTIAARGEHFPFRDNSVDAVVDVFGAIYYLPNVETLEQYLKEVRRVLKLGGRFHACAAHIRGEGYPSSEELEHYLQNAGFSFIKLHKYNPISSANSFIAE